MYFIIVLIISKTVASSSTTNVNRSGDQQFAVIDEVSIINNTIDDLIVYPLTKSLMFYPMLIYIRVLC